MNSARLMVGRLGLNELAIVIIASEIKHSTIVSALPGFHSVYGSRVFDSSRRSLKHGMVDVYGFAILAA